ncbi:HK97-gp10 family putative phage morphogenesis protein [Caballeronia sp. dw_276]|uniref:HK97-gp10 family putative phage morphogenesis protein n=1 Tax=Caballeronia sp. dw_276 TaxID=2719795 RepID=UPI001BD68B4A|nr:HK97-gp10 family putative phage morphogenesis protein [Caballeronia sp. dw_276]
MAKNFSVENLQAMTDVLRGLENVARESVLRQAAVAGARVIFEEVKLRAPVGDKVYERKGGTHTPGKLRDSILIAYDKDVSVTGKLASYIVTWSKEAFYGRFLEFGTSKMEAKPFLRPGYDAKKQQAADAVDAVIQTKVAEFMHGK